MTEAVRRYRETGGSDVVRRLLARPIRLDPPRPAPQEPASLAADETLAIEADAFDPGASAHEAAEPDAGAFADDGIEDGAEAVLRLRAEMAVMKAILMAERAESAALRARIERDVEADTLGADARATRERWAAMVDRLLLSAR